jgi:hypothetical protein
MPSFFIRPRYKCRFAPGTGQVGVTRCFSEVAGMFNCLLKSVGFIFHVDVSGLLTRYIGNQGEILRWCVTLFLNSPGNVNTLIRQLPYKLQKIAT